MIETVILFQVFSGDLSADPAKSILQLPNCPSKHPPNESNLAMTTYGKAVTI